MRYIVEEAVHAKGAYVFDTVQDRVVELCDTYHQASDITYDLNILHEARGGHQPVAGATVPDETVNRLKSGVLNDEASARWWAQEAVDLMRVGHERGSHVKSKKAEAARNRARDVRIVLKALGIQV